MQEIESLGIVNVYNADQTAVFFELLPKKTVNVRGAKTVWVKCGKKEKARATAMILADWEGNKLDPFVVFKTEKSKVKEVVVETLNNVMDSDAPCGEKFIHFKRSSTCRFTVIRQHGGMEVSIARSWSITLAIGPQQTLLSCC